MINIPKFENEFHGRQFKSSTGTLYTAVGYGDNDSNGGAYIIGMEGDSTGVRFKTFLLRDVTFVSATPSTT